MGARRLFCWSGGGLPGLDIHCGIWKALEQAGIRSAANCGTSAGAVVAALDSAGVGQAQAEARLRKLSDADVVHKRAFWKLRLATAESLCRPEPIAELLESMLPPWFGWLEKPLIVHATDDATGIGVDFAGGPRFSAHLAHISVPRAVLASMAIAGIFPPVRHVDATDAAAISTRWYSDGGTTENLPLPDRLSDYDEVWLLIAKRPVGYARRRDSILSRLMYNADMLIEAQVREAVSTARRLHPCVRVIRPSLASQGGALHFDHELIGDAHAIASRQIAAALKETHHV